MKSFRQFFTEAVEGKTAVFSYGRYNPPTTGHQLLINKLAAIANEKQADAFLIPTHTLDKKKNPLNINEKINILQQMAPGIKILETGKTLIEALKDLQAKGYTSIIQVAGSDRIPEFTHIRDAYNNKPNKAGEIPFSFKTYDIASSGDRDPDSDGVEGMSASKLRELALAGNIEEFKQGMSTTVNNDTKTATYNTIRERLS
jgi:hypothetical protein